MADGKGVPCRGGEFRQFAFLAHWSALMTSNSRRMPTIFLSHGGGPCFWLDSRPPFAPNAFEGLRRYLASLLAGLPARPKAIVVISGHWEEAVPTVSTSAAPPMLFDYYGFPEHTYRLSYPAPGHPALAEQLRRMLAEAGIATAADAERGFDHGVFVPFLIVDPQARIPVVMLSLQHDLDPVQHLAIGAALEPLRDEDVLIVGSGNSYHNLRHFFDGEPAAAATFDAWLTEAVTDSDPAVRRRKLTDWARAPAARLCHPREEHLLPLMVAAGAGECDAGENVFSDVVMKATISAFRFG